MEVSTVFGESPFVTVIVFGLAVGLGILVDRFILARTSKSKIAQARLESKRLLEDAEREADRIRVERIDKVEEALREREELLEYLFAVLESDED